MSKTESAVPEVGQYLVHMGGWAGLQKYANLVTPNTLLAWHRRFVAAKYAGKQRINMDRRQEMAVIGDLCVKFAEENPDWGYDRIQGALVNLGYEVSGTTVGNILRSKGIFPAPERGKRSNWQQFVRSHMEVWTLLGLVCFQVFFVMFLAKRQVQIAHIGCQMNGRHGTSCPEPDRWAGWVSPGCPVLCLRP